MTNWLEEWNKYDGKIPEIEVLAKAIVMNQSSSVVNSHIEKSLMEARCTLDLIKSLKEGAESAEKLSRKIYWLNWALLGATAVGAIAAAVQTITAIIK